MTVAVVIDDYSLAAVPGLDAELARAGALVMRSFGATPSPHLLQTYRGVAVVGGADRAGLLARLERATATLAAPVIAVLPPGVAPDPALRGPGVVDLVPAGSPGVAARVLLMASVPVVAPRGRVAPGTAGAERPAPPTPIRSPGSGEGDPDVVAVASSTGGVWVLARVLRALPPRGRAVLVAQHMEAEFVPSFAAWLEGASGWRVVVVEGSTPLAPGLVYVAAGGHDLVLDGGAARMAPATSRFVPSADRLLASVGRLGARAVGLVLSGMGSDGAAGLAEIGRQGGIALCQAPATAVVPSMPEAALRATPAAIPLPPEALAPAIAARQVEGPSNALVARR